MVKHMSSNAFIFLLFSAFYLLPSSVFSQPDITLEDVFERGTFQTRSVADFWFLLDGQHYTRKEGSMIKKFNILSGAETDILFDGAAYKNTGSYDGTIGDYSFSKSENKILIVTGSEPVYRHSSKDQVFVFDRQSEKLTPVFTKGKISNATLSPDESKIAFTFDNNLYFQDLTNGNVVQVTRDGVFNQVINGMCDWVYEEEFSFTRAFEWSENSRYLAFIRFDESKVPQFTMEYFEGALYPRPYNFKYPKVGEKNADVKVLVFDSKKRKSVTVPLDHTTELYVPRIKWTKADAELVVYTLNRHQNHMQWVLYNASDKKTRLLYEEKNKYYIDIHDHTFFLNDKKSFITVSEREGYNQLYHYDMNGTLLRKLTPGQYDINNVYGVDEKNNRLYFNASIQNPMQSGVYSIQLDGSGLVELSSQKGANSAQFNSTFDLFVLHHSTINTPPVSALYKLDKSKIRSLENNEKVTKKLDEYKVSPIEFFDFTTSEGVRLNGWMCKPRDFDPNKKYPVFMTQYSGPGSQSVVDRWGGTNYWWHQMLAQKGYIVACVDGRGTGNRGEEFKKMTYLKLGHYETIDQIEAARYLASLSFVDGSRIGIYGWSYGGFMSSLCLLKGNDVFKSAIAVAPVTSWKWYDSIYTERYMRTEEENPDGYAANSPVYFADRLKGNYLLIHGMADDNVHFQHSVEMANALIKHKKQFETYFYPNRNHGIYGENARIHLFTKMTNFIYEKI